MSERCADLFSGKTKTDEEVQIEFLIKGRFNICQFLKQMLNLT